MTSITVRFVEPNGEVREIADAKPGASLMEVAKANGIEGIAGDCGGACACATCHVHVAPRWMSLVGDADEIEAEMLDMALFVQETSRLSCQIILSAQLDGLEVQLVPGS